MSYADTLATALRDATQAAYAPCYQAGGTFAHAVQAVAKADDVVVVMQAAIDAVVAIEALHAATDAAVKALRATLADTMESSGATTVQGEHQSAHLAKKPAFLNIVNEAAIPRDYYVQPPPALDKRAVLSALKDGVEVPGVSLATPNAMSLVIRAKKEAA